MFTGKTLALYVLQKKGKTEFCHFVGLYLIQYPFNQCKKCIYVPSLSRQFKNTPNMLKSESSKICDFLALKGLKSQNAQGCQPGTLLNIDKHPLDHQNP